MNIKQLEQYFNSIELSESPIELKQGETIINVKKYIDANLSYLKSNPGNKAFTPYYERLIQLKNKLDYEKENKS